MAVAKTRLPTRIKIKRHEESGLPVAARLGVGVGESAARGTRLAKKVQTDTVTVKAILNRDCAFTIGKFYCDLVMPSTDLFARGRIGLPNGSFLRYNVENLAFVG
jgi:hypothetical protein